jgi:hypothetical protein
MINHGVPERAEMTDEVLLQFESGVVRANRDP